MNQPSKPTFQLSPRRRELLDAFLQKKGVKTSASPMISPMKRGETIPLSFAQERLWFLDQFQPGSSIYNIPRTMEMHGLVDVSALERGINEIVRRHEALRTTFRAVDSRPVQVIAPSLAVPLPVFDLRGLPDERRSAESARIVAGEFTRPFDLARGPLLRTALLRLGDNDWVFVLAMHHIVSDGHSIEVFFSELSALYQAYSGGQQSPLQDPPTQYADYTVWQREWLQGEVLDAQLAYWKKHLDGAPHVLELPADRPRPPVQSFRGALQPLVIAPALADELQALSHREGVTMFMTLLAAFDVLLHRYTGQTKLVVGTPIANRNREEIEGLIGFFVNTLVLCTDVSGDPTFRELLARVREVALGAYGHPDLPFEKLVEEMHPERNLGHNPLFQVMFTVQSIQSGSAPPEREMFQESDTPADQAPAALDADEPTDSEGPVDIMMGTAKFDLNLSFIQTPKSLTGAIEYNTDLFDHAPIARMIAHLKTLLAAVVANPDRRLSTLPLLTPRERRQLHEWNDRRADYPDRGGIHELFEAQVERTPDAPALLFEGEQLTYRELDTRANQVAHRLRSLGVGPEIPVGLFMDRSIEAITGLLGALKAGGVHLPLDPAYPSKRLAYMVEDSRAPVVLTQARLRERLPPSSARVICLDAEWDEIAKAPAERSAGGASPESPAYLIYTSGSTGQPKGVAVKHRTLLNLITWQITNSSLPAGASTLQYASLSFDVSLQEVFATLCCGGRLVLISEQERRDVGRLLQRLAEASVARLFLPYIALQHLAEGITSADLAPTTLREVVTAGEQLQITPAIRAMFRGLDGCLLRNQYGPSETHVVSDFVLEGSPEDWPTLPPIGRPISNTQLHTLDAYLQPVPIGVPGELHVGGASLARGYLHRPDLTAERFLPDPVGDAQGARLYKTGDVARYRADGAIEFLGRVDHQVKVRGYRIELGEIEAVLGAHPSVRETVTVVRADSPGDKRLVAYLAASADLSVSELRSYLKDRLPEYMVPSAYVLMDALPLTPSGKVDRMSLPAPDQDRPRLDGLFVAPITPVEQGLAAIWCGILNVQRVGIHDNFFDLGGHSLSATQVISRVRDAFGVDIPLIRLFEMPTIAELVVALLETQIEQAGAEAGGRMLDEVEALAPEVAAALCAQGS